MTVCWIMQLESRREETGASTVTRTLLKASIVLALSAIFLLACEPNDSDHASPRFSLQNSLKNLASLGFALLILSLSWTM